MDTSKKTPTTELQWLSHWVDLSSCTKLIELGCGSARFLQNLLTMHPQLEAWGLEVDKVQHQKNVAQAVPRLTWLEAGAQAIPSESNVFDGALMLKSLHHVPIPDMQQALREVARVVKPGGWLFVAEPVYAGALNEIMRLFNDEGEVRAEAIKALHQMVQDGVWEQHYHEHFEVPVAYADFSEFEQRMLRPTFVDKVLSDALREQIRAAFEPHMTATGVHLTRPMQVWFLRKPSA